MKLYLLFIINLLIQYSTQDSNPINVFSDIQTDTLISKYIKVTSILGGSQYIPMDQNVYLKPCDGSTVAPYQVIEANDAGDFNADDYVCLKDPTIPYTGDFGKYQFRNFNAKDPVYYGQVNEIQGSEQRSLIQVTNGSVSVYPSFTPIPNNTINPDIIQLFTQDSTQLYLDITGFKQCPFGTKTDWYIENHASENYKIYLCTDDDNPWNPQFKTTQSELITYDQIGQQFTQTFSEHKTVVTDCTRQAYYYKNPSSGKYTSLCFRSGNEQVCSNVMQFIDRSQTSNMINVMPIYGVQPMKFLGFENSDPDRYIYKDGQGTIRETYVMDQDITDSDKLLRFNVPIVVQGQTIKQHISEYFATNGCHLSQSSSDPYIEYGNHKIYFAEPSL